MASLAAQLKLQEEERRKEQIKKILSESKVMRSTGDNVLDLEEHFSNYKNQFIRTSESFKSKLKSSNEGKQILEAARHLFGKYKVPAVLDRVWLNATYRKTTPVEDHQYHQHRQRLARGGFQRNNVLRRERMNEFNHLGSLTDWYVCVATGGSLFKSYTQKMGLSKRETFTFLNASGDMDPPQALVWAIAACAQGGNMGVAARLSQTNLARKDITQAFWQEAIRFFCLEGNHPNSVKEVNDLLDYVTEMKNENPSFRLLGSGQSLLAMQRRCEQWHRALARRKVIGNNAWEGAPLEDWKYIQNEGQRDEETWEVRQIKCGKDLAAEGTAMNHCVLSYSYRCESGHTSIWSVRRTTRDFIEKRTVTVEMNSQYEICQVRGIFNRAARPEEKNIITRWAQANGLRIASY